MKGITQSFRIFLLMTLLTGVIYPLLVTGIARAFFPGKAGASLVMRDGKVVGSSLIGQQFHDPKYFHSRPSACDYQTVPSGASNLGPASRELAAKILERRNLFLSENQLPPGTQVPAEMLTTSGSGLDPDISKQAALMQVKRISEARHCDVTGQRKIISLVMEMTESPQYSLFGEARVNVLMLNLELDKLNLCD